MLSKPFLKERCPVPLKRGNTHGNTVRNLESKSTSLKRQTEIEGSKTGEAREITNFIHMIVDEPLVGPHRVHGTADDLVV
jgi:hypothetical protein